MKNLVDLTDRFPGRIDLEGLRAELRMLETGISWVGHYDADLADGWTAVPLVSHDGTMDRVDSQRLGKWGQYRRTPIVEKLPVHARLLDSFLCPHGRIRVMRMEPGTIIRPHRDVFQEVANFAFKQVRLHIPIETNPDVVFVVGGERIHLEAGRLYYVNFSKEHYVRNDGKAMRTHLVMDLQVNDWLRSIFPPESVLERASNLVERLVLPIHWYAHAASNLPGRLFWRMYEGSRLRALRHRLRDNRAQT